MQFIVNRHSGADDVALCADAFWPGGCVNGISDSRARIAVFAQARTPVRDSRIRDVHRVGAATKALVGVPPRVSQGAVQDRRVGAVDAASSACRRFLPTCYRALGVGDQVYSYSGSCGVSLAGPMSEDHAAFSWAVRRP